MSTSEATTNGVQVEAAARFSAEHSAPHLAQWFFLYTIRITNEGAETVQLMGRHWIITDADGEVEQVRGSGVVGQQPILAPGQSFEYTSACPLATPFGTMQGTYRMVRSRDGEEFEVSIAPFALSEPYAIN